MSHNSHQGISGCYEPTGSDASAPSSENERPIPRDRNSSSSLLKVLPNSAHVNPGPVGLACPVSGCSLILKGRTPHGYLWRHLKRPGVHGRTGDEKAAWENLHKIEHDRLLATRITPTQRKREANKVKAQKRLRTAEFRQRARNMGITEELVPQKVAIWEGMWVAEQKGEGNEYHAWALLDFCITP